MTVSDKIFFAEYYPESKSASHKKINQKIETAARNSEPTSFCHRPLGIPDSHQEPYGFPPPARNPQLPFQTSPHYPALPLPPVNLPPSLLLPLPPPPPPMPLEYPKVPTKNATLPHDLQNSSYNNNATLASMSASTVSPNKQTQQDAPERLSIGSKRSFESHSTAFDGYNHSKGKRIVWHKQPGASTSTLVGQDESQAEPGAWYYLIFINKNASFLFPLPRCPWILDFSLFVCLIWSSLLITVYQEAALLTLIRNLQGYVKEIVECIIGK